METAPATRTREASPRRALRALLALPDEAIDLAQASLLIAREEYPDLQVTRYLDLLDDMADELKGRLRGGEGPMSCIAHLNRFLFDDLGFRGNRQDYHDPRNSFLNDVLDRRVGIPISLSTDYIENGRRVGCPVGGVSFPGHFLVRYLGREATAEILIDPFNRGLILTAEECRARLARMFGNRVEYTPHLLRRARNREIIGRMLNNLKGIYARGSDFHRALRIQETILCLHPEAPEHVRDRGLLYYRVACLGEAARDLDAYLRAAPEAPDADRIRDHLRKIRLLAPTMN
jgi:regulator of sirC expression with transglutaminase-like and TPR domain